MKVTSDVLQKNFMKCVITMACGLGINCTVTTDAGMKSFDVETGKVTESDKEQTVITGQLSFDFSDIMQDVVIESKRPVEDLTFRDLYRRLSRNWINSGPSYIGDDADEECNPRFNNWYIYCNEDTDHDILNVLLNARSNINPLETIFECTLIFNRLIDKCKISHSPAPDNFPVNRRDHEISMKTKIIDTDEWGMKFHNKDIMEKLKDKLILLSRD